MKFGKTASAPWKRLATLQTAHSEALRLLTYVDWPDEAEEFIHRFLAARGCAIRGEWFRPDFPVWDVVAVMLSGTIEQLAALPQKKDTRIYFDSHGNEKGRSEGWSATRIK